MCLDEYGLSFRAGEKFLTHKRDLCNKKLELNRSLICQALYCISSSSSKVIHCLDGNSSCGLMGMLWKKYLGNNVKVEINGIFLHSLDVISANVNSNKLNVDLHREEPCSLLRQNAYEFIFLNCKTTASHYLDSLFSKVEDNAVIAITTSEDPSLYWQTPDVPCRNYGGVIIKTSYFRELGIRLVIAAIARAAARYTKGIAVLCSVSFKTQQSFTIIFRVKKGPKITSECLKQIQTLLHCSVCEDRAFVPNSEFALESPSSLLSCDCSKKSDVRTVNQLGPVWSGAIFSVEFIELMISHTIRFPWGQKINHLLMQILEEARCGNGVIETKEPDSKKFKQVDTSNSNSSTCQPSFYFNTHKQHPSNSQLLKMSSIIQILRNSGFRASRTHFDPESVRTNASLQEFIQLLEQHK